MIANRRSHTVSGRLGRNSWLGPLVEVCPGFELIASEDAAALGHDLLEFSKGPEVAVGERLIQNRPEALGGLKLGRIPGQVDEPDPLRHGQVRLGVPAGVVEPKHDEPIPSRPSLARKQGQERGKERLGHPVRYIPERLARDAMGRTVAKMSPSSLEATRWSVPWHSSSTI